MIPKILTKFYILFTPCITIFYNMILNFIYLQNYLQKISSSKISSQFFCFRLYRPTGPVDRIMCPGRARSCTSVGQPTGRPTCKPQLSVNFGRPTGRPTVNIFVSFLRPVDRTVDPSPTAICQQGGRPTGPVGRQACCCPTALSSLVNF